MGGRDLTQWVESCSVVQGQNNLYKEFTITFAGWHNLEIGSLWDIYATYDSANPNAELLIRAGVIPPDFQPSITVDGGVPKLTVKGYDGIYIATRKRPRQTLVFASDLGEARRLVEKSDQPIGRYSTVRMPAKMMLGFVVRSLANFAEFRCQYQAEDIRLDAFIMDPQKSYWQQISDLIAPVAPYVFYRGENNTLVITDPVASQTNVGTSMEIPEKLIASVSDIPVRRRRVQRVIVRIPR